MAKKRIKGSIHEAQHDKNEKVKRNLELATRGPYDWTMYHELGFEGKSEVLAEAMTKQNAKNLRNAYYLNHAYVKIKPDFSIMRYEGTDDPQPRPVNGNFCGVFQVKDAIDGEEMVLWLYTTPKDRNKWERLHVQLRYIINRLQFMGMDYLDEDGYLPVVIKLGRMPTQFATKFARVVSWDFSLGSTAPTNEQFNEMNHVQVSEMTHIPPKFPNEYETTDGELRIQESLE